jgi:predicted alpha/beta hydrolase
VTGFVTDTESIDRLVFIGGHTGFYGDYRRSVRLQMFLTWHVLMPAVTQIVGYFPGRRFGLPADLPLGVALEWAARIRPNFWWNIRRGGSPDSKRIDELRSRFAAFSAKGLLLRTRDDSFATAGSSARLAALFSNTEFSQRNLNPRKMGLGRVGHFGYFRSKCRNSIWPLIENWVAIGKLDRSNLEGS